MLQMRSVYRALFVVTAGMFLLLAILGSYASVELDGGPPWVANTNPMLEAKSLYFADDRAGAIERLRTIALIDPYNNPEALQKLQDVAVEEKDRASEIFALRRLVRVERGNAALHNRLATLLVDKNRWEADEAVMHSLVALRLDPNSAQAFANLGFAALGAGNAAKAEEFFRRALELDPRLERAQQGLREALRQAG